MRYGAGLAGSMDRYGKRRARRVSLPVCASDAWTAKDVAAAVASEAAGTRGGNALQTPDADSC